MWNYEINSITWGEIKITLNRLKNNFFNIEAKSEINFKLISYSFSNFCENSSPLDIYSGNESIPFEKRDSLFKNILRKEFSDAIKEFNKTIDKFRKKT